MINILPQSLQCAKLVPCILAQHITNGEGLSGEEPFTCSRDRRLFNFERLRADDPSQDAKETLRTLVWDKSVRDGGDTITA